MLRLKTPIEYNKDVSSICLSKDNSVQAHDGCVTIGRSNTKPDNGKRIVDSIFNSLLLNDTLFRRHNTTFESHNNANIADCRM